jgi:hypothetical protein
MADERNELEEILEAQEARIDFLEQRIRQMADEIPSAVTRGRQSRPDIIWEGQEGTLGAIMPSVAQWQNAVLGKPNIDNQTQNTQDK